MTCPPWQVEGKFRAARLIDAGLWRAFLERNEHREGQDSAGDVGHLEILRTRLFCADALEPGHRQTVSAV